MHVSEVKVILWPWSSDQDQDQDSLPVKRRNDNHSPGPVIRELVPSSHLGVTQISSFSTFFRNQWANQTQTSCRSFLGWGNESLFKWSWSHYPDCHQAHIWWKHLKIFFYRTKWPRSLKLGIYYWALVSLNDDPRLTFLHKGQLWFLMHLYGERLKFRWITQKLLKSMLKKLVNIVN